MRASQASPTGRGVTSSSGERHISHRRESEHPFVLYQRERAKELLAIGSGNPEAEFREGQDEAIRRLLDGDRRLLVVQKTGWGKSFVYFIAVKLLREAGFGPALLVSPLLSLMRNQMAAAERMGVRAATINSDNFEDWPAIERDVAQDKIDILLISPERFANDRFSSTILDDIAARISLLVIDEAHCISDWGHDFRPHYRLIERIVRHLPRSVRLLATTATANDRVMADLENVLGPGLDRLRGELSRPSLTLQSIRMDGQAERMAWIADTLRQLPGHGIIYTATVRDADMLSAWLRHCGFDCPAYTAATGDDRERIEQALLDNRVKALVATTALGMGYDKPDLAFVIHYQMPGSVVAYYQQVGRAGRALPSAYGVLLCGEEDARITEWFIDSAFPTRDEAREVLNALESDDDGLSVPEIQQRVNLRQSRIVKTLDLLALESPSPVAKVGSKWQLTPAMVDASFFERADRLTALRREEHREMQRYLELEFGRHMEFLVKSLDGDAAGIGPPPLPPLDSTVAAETVARAVEYLRRTNLPIEPRSTWPPGGLRQFGLKGRITEDMRPRPGRALSAIGDSGWGERVRIERARDGRFSNDLVAAAVAMVRAWNPDPPPQWVTFVPSLRRPRLVAELAEAVASALGLRFHTALERIADGPEQSAFRNSSMKAKNIDAKFAAVPGPLPEGPCLLVDDIVDSRWTITVTSCILKKAGCGDIWPMALAEGVN